MEEEAKVENIIIIGGGPAGLAASLYSARAGLSPLVFAGSPPGGQLMLTTEVENYPGFESIMGPDLIKKYRDHTAKFGTRIIDENIVNVDFTKKPLEVTTPTKTYKARAAIITVGASALWLGLPSETRLRGRGVSACATCDGFFFKEKVVGVVGGGDTAAEEALFLTRFASKVYIFHRRSELRASKIMAERVLKHPKIEMVWNTQVEEVLGENKVEGVRLVKTSQDQSRQGQDQTPPPAAGLVEIAPRQFQLIKTNHELKRDGLFIAIGHKPDTGAFKDKIVMDEKGYIITFNQLAERYLKGKEVAQDMVKKIQNESNHYSTATSVPGVFAAGDCVDFVYRQAGTAAGMGIAAALDAERWLEGSSTEATW